MTRGMTALAIGALVLALAHGSAWAEAMALKLLPNYSRATFKSDAPLETFVGNTAADGIGGALTVDPERPQTATGSIRVDMNLVRTGIDKRDADMRANRFLDTEVEGNRWVTYEIKGVEIAGPLEAGKAIPARVRGILTVKQRPVERVAETTVTWIKLTPAQLESQKRFGFTADNIKVRARFATTFTDHGMQVPQLLIFKVSNEIQLETDLTFARQ
jgi:polyisoprenoid-binding protein YceI